MAKEKIVRTDSAMYGKTWNGKGTWSRVEATQDFSNNHDDINWGDHTPETLDVKKVEGKTIYKVKI